jgi:phenylacetate-coenzyme A ligase PaaK-like adenylate-forming protein
MLEAAKKRLMTFAPDRTKWTKVDEAIYGVDDIYRVEKAKAQNLLLEAIKYSFRYHFEHNDFYRRFCQGEHVTPDLIKDYSDLVRIPLIPDTFFKDYPAGPDFFRWLQKITSETVPQIELNGANSSFDAVIAALQEKEFTIIFSSGTSGNLSFHPRDALSWQRQQYCYGCAVAETLGSYHDPGLAAMLVVPDDENINSR